MFLGSLLLLALFACPVIHASSGVSPEEEPSSYQEPVFEQEQTHQEVPLTGPEICALTGYFVLPHPCNCQLFYTWFQGQFVENLCEAGLYFDSITLNCVLPEEVTCADGFGPPPPMEESAYPPHSTDHICPWEGWSNYA